MDFIISALMNNGLKSTTMDSIASSRKISKRTLYEIFGSKEEMFSEAFVYFHKKQGAKLKEVFNSSNNIMEAILKCFLYNRDLMGRMNVQFIRDINQFSHLQSSKNVDSHDKHHHLHFYDVLKKGVEEGYFRDDLNLLVLCRMFALQMESLKRMEELFPEDITLLEAYDSISISFLRGLCTPKGMEEIDRVIPELNSEYIKQIQQS